MNKQVRVGVIGSYAVGMTIACDHFPAGGETVPGRNFEMMHGGKGSNQAVAAARLGAEVTYGGCVGKDSFGDMCLKLFQEESMDASYITKSETGRSTGVGLIYVNGEGENEIVIDFAANYEFSCEDVDRMMPALKECQVLLMQLEISLETVAYAAKKCREWGITFILNPAPFTKIPEELLKNSDFLTPNQTEARLLLGLDSKSPVSDEEVAVKIHQMGVRNVIMTLGSKGTLIVNDVMQKRIPGISVETVDTTGAGDTFSAGFSVAIAEGKSIEEAVRFGNVAAGLAVTKYGVIASIPYRNQVDERIEKEEK